jgi:hypothetical protein
MDGNSAFGKNALIFSKINLYLLIFSGFQVDDCD